MSTFILNRRSRVLPIGIDVGHTAVRVAQLRHGGGGYELLRAARLPVLRDASGQLDAEACGASLRRRLRQQRFPGRRAMVSVGPPDAEYHLLQLPPDTLESKAGPVIAAELSRLVRSDPAALQMAHWWLPRARGEAGGVIGVAVPRGHVAQLYGVCSAAGLECVRMDADACALVRFAIAVRGTAADYGQQVWGLLDLGHRTARLILFLGEIPVLARSFDAGGGKWTRRVAEWFGISEESAAIHKHDYGVASHEAGDAELPVAELGGMMRGALREELQNVTLQIERSYAYVLQCYAQSTAGELVMVGGGAELKGLADHLTDKLGIPVRRGEHFVDAPGSRLKDRRPDIERRVSLGELAGAIGSAIGAEAPS